MPSPVTPSQFNAAIPANNADFCDRFNAWLSAVSLLYQLVNWLLDPSGNLSEEFKAEVATYSTPTGSIIYCLTQDVGTGWLECNGAEVSREDYAALFKAIGTRYGDGNTTTTFNLPDFRGRSLIGAGAGSGLTNRDINAAYVGEESHTQTIAEMPAHHHEWVAPTSRIDDRGSGSDVAWRGTTVEDTEDTGGGQPFNVIHPCGIAFVLIKT